MTCVRVRGAGWPQLTIDMMELEPERHNIKSGTHNACNYITSLILMCMVTDLIIILIVIA